MSTFSLLNAHTDSYFPSALTVFLVVMTNFLLLIGAGLFSRCVGAYEMNAFNTLLGADVDDSGGDGTGSFPVSGNIWHLDCCNPEDNLDGQGWSIFNAIFGWSNNGSCKCLICRSLLASEILNDSHILDGTVLSYIFYWLAAIVALICMKFTEGRSKLFGRESAAAVRRRERQEKREAETNADIVSPSSRETREKSRSKEDVAEVGLLPR